MCVPPNTIPQDRLTLFHKTQHSSSEAVATKTSGCPGPHTDSVCSTSRTCAAPPAALLRPLYRPAVVPASLHPEDGDKTIQGVNRSAESVQRPHGAAVAAQAQGTSSRRPLPEFSTTSDTTAYRVHFAPTHTEEPRREMFVKFWCRARHSFYLFCNFSYDTYTLFFLGMFSCWAFFLPEVGK